MRVERVKRGSGKAKFARYWEVLRTNRPVSRGCSSIAKGGLATIPSPPPGTATDTCLRFIRHDGIYRSDETRLLTNLGRSTASRWSGPSQATPNRDGWSATCPSLTMSSDRLFLDRDARQQCPSPLHRHAQTTTQFSLAWPKGDISTLPAGGPFYFALTLDHKMVDFAC